MDNLRFLEIARVLVRFDHVAWPHRKRESLNCKFHHRMNFPSRVPWLVTSPV